MSWGQLCRRCSYRLWQIFVIIVILLAIMVSTLRLLAPYADHIKQPLQNWFIKNHQLSVDYQQFDIEWHHFGLYLTLKEVEIDPLEGKDQLKQLESLRVRFEPWSSLLHQQVRMGEIQLKGVELELSSAPTTQDPKNSSSLSWQDILKELTNDRFDAFELVDAKLHWLNQSGQRKTFVIPTLIWRNEPQKHSGEGLAHMAGYPEQQVNFIVDIAGEEANTIHGQLYLNVEHLSVTPFIESELHQEVKLQQGEINFKSWVDFDWQKVSQAQIVFGENTLQWQSEGVATPHHIRIEEGSIDYRSTPEGWQLQTHNLKIGTHNYVWPELQFSAEQKNQQINAELPEIDLAGFTPLLEFAPGLSQSLLQLTGTTHGSLKDLRWQQQVSKSNPDKNEWLLSGRLFQAGWDAAGEIPGVETINAEFELTPEQLLTHIEMPEQVITSGEQFAQDLVLESLQTQISATRSQQSWQFNIPKLSLAATDLAGELSARLSPNQAGETQLFLYGELALSNASHAWYYFPKAMSKNLAAYLKRALQAGHTGNTRLLWHGALADFPFANQAGKFQIDVPLQESTFAFQKNWPALAPLDMTLWFENRDLTMTASRAFLKNVEVKKLKAVIPGLNKNSVLSIEGQFDGQAEAVREVMQESALAHSVGSALESLQLKGLVSGPLRLDIPLNHGNKTKVQGYADLTQAQLNIPGTEEHQIQDVKGRVYYQGPSIRIENLTGHYHQLPVTVSLTGEPVEKDYQVQARLSGEWPADQIQNIPGVALPLAHGSVKWRGSVDAKVRKEGVTTEIRVTSDLKDLVLDFPAPLNKQASSSWPLKVDIELTPQHLMTGRAVAGDQLFAMWQTDLSQTGSPNDFVWAGVGTQSPLKGTPPGVTLDARLKQFDLTPWLNLPIARNESQQSTALLPFEQGHWQVENLQLFDYQINQVELALKATGQQIDATVTGPEVQADVSYLHQPESELKVHSRQLVVQAIEKEVATAEEAAQEKVETSDAERLAAFPHLDILCHQCQIDKLFFDQLRLVTRTDPLAGQWRAEEAWFQSGSGRVEFEELAWQLVGDLSQSRAVGTVSATDVDEMVRTLLPQTEIPIKDSKVTGEFQFVWPGAPQDFETEKLSGTFDCKLGEGHIAKVSDKGTRLFTLLSLDSLIRKIRLDFSDLFKQGLFYKELNGDFVFDDGYVTSEAIEMDGLAGAMTIKGQTNLHTQVMDYDVVFKPDLTGSLPLLAGLTINPVTGIYVLALNTVIKPVMEIVTQLEFKVTGTTDNPIVTEVGRKKREIKVEQAKPEPTPAAETTATPEAKPALNATEPQAQTPTQKPELVEPPAKVETQPEAAPSNTEPEAPLLPELPVAAPITVGGDQQK